MELKEESRNYYKVVGFRVSFSGIEKVYTSVWMSGDSCITYKINEWVESLKVDGMEEYQLFVFDTLKNAENFCQNFSNYGKIFKCKIMNRAKKLPKYYYCRLGLVDKKICVPDIKWPEGTVMAERVMIYGEPLNV